MNRLFYLIIVALLAISCESDNCPAPDQEANEIECTFTVGIPEIKTRAADPSGSGQYATSLYYRFYDENDQPLSISGAYHTGKPDDNGEITWTISKKLVEGRKYYFYLWAGKKEEHDRSSMEQPYTTVFTNGTPPQASTVSMNESECLANQDSYDVFCTKKEIIAGVDPGVILLHRPTAQLNIATGDFADAEKLGVEVVSSGITLAKMETVYDFNGQTSAVVENFDFKQAAIPTYSVTLNNGTEDKDYRILSSNYIMMKNAEKETQNIVFRYTDSDGNVIEREFTAVPIQRNYRTYIVGDLLTVDGSYTLTVQPMMDPASDKTVTVSAR